MYTSFLYHISPYGHTFAYLSLNSIWKKNYELFVGMSTLGVNLGSKADQAILVEISILANTHKETYLITFGLEFQIIILGKYRSTQLWE